MENKFAIIEHEIEGIKAKIGIVQVVREMKKEERSKLLELLREMDKKYTVMIEELFRETEQGKKGEERRR